MAGSFLRFMLILSAVRVVTSTKEPTVCGDKWCICYHRNKTAKCHGHGRNLTFIPKLPTYVMNLEFSDNFLPALSPVTFRNVSSLHLKIMTMAFNKIHEISENAFFGMSSITTLVLDGNKLSSKTLDRAFPSLSKLLLFDLSLKYMRLKGTNVFMKLQAKHLHSLLLDKNDLKLYNHSHFANFPNLNILSLRNNRIQNVVLVRSLNLQKLDLRNNHLLNIPDFCTDNETFFPNLQEVHLDHNLIMSIPQEHIRCLKKLVVFTINSNRILEIKENTFSELHSLGYIILRNLFSTQMIEKYAFKNSHVKYITLSHSSLHFKIIVHKDAFKGCTNIVGIDISGNMLYDSTDHDLNDWFGHLKSLTGIGLGSTGLKTVPEFISLKLTNLMYLKLYTNNIKSLPVDGFTALKNLTHLWLGDNLIAKIDEEVFTEDVRKRLQVIDIENNPFACTCELLWFLNWIKQDSFKFSGFPKKYLCDSPSSMSGMALSKVDLTRETCIIQLFASIVIMSTSGCVLVIIFTLSIVYRLRWHIRYYVYTRKHKQGDQRPIEVQEWEYDAYVIYSQENVRWIKNELIANLEGHDLRLYVRNRDSMPGIPIVDNVVNNIAVSRGILIVLSNVMARDEECQFELMFVQRQEEGQRRPIILVLLEEVQAANVTHTVYALVRMHSYISWGNDVDARDMFWNRLKHSLNTLRGQLEDI